jgi:threonine dehydratase
MIPFEWIGAAERQIAPYVKETPLTYDQDHILYIKWENHQITGSFKARGAFNKILNLEAWEREAGLLAASAGNHGQGVALAGQKTGAAVKIYAPQEAPAVKVAGMRDLGAEVILIPGGYSAAEKAALAEAEQGHATWISPYNDGHIIAGQATLGLEISRQLETYAELALDETTWYIPVSGGGLLAGIATALQNSSQRPRIVGVQTVAAAFMHSLFYRGTQAGILETPTLADGLAGEVEANSITIPLIREYVDEIILIDEEPLRQMIHFAWQHYHERIEAAAATALAAALSEQATEGPKVVVISGGNIDQALHRELVAEQR